MLTFFASLLQKSEHSSDLIDSCDAEATKDSKRWKNLQCWQPTLFKTYGLLIHIAKRLRLRVGGHTS